MATDSKGWKVYRKEWYNDRIMETYINAPIIDKQNDLIPTNVLEDSMDFYMKYGVYSYQHEEIPIGLPLAYKIDEGKIKVVKQRMNNYKLTKKQKTKLDKLIKDKTTDPIIQEELGIVKAFKEYNNIH